MPYPVDALEPQWALYQYHEVVPVVQLQCPVRQSLEGPPLRVSGPRPLLQMLPWDVQPLQTRVREVRPDRRVVHAVGVSRTPLVSSRDGRSRCTDDVLL